MKSCIKLDEFGNTSLPFSKSKEMTSGKLKRLSSFFQWDCAAKPYWWLIGRITKTRQVM
jgi:hypothetical protein